MKSILLKLGNGESLSPEEAYSAMTIIMEGGATDAQIGAMLFALKVRGETSGELLGFVRAMRHASLTIQIDDPNAVDVCGTGGDGKGTFNISTVSAFVVSGAGVTVAKHGNRSVSSSCGSADLLRELGVRIELPPDRVRECVNGVGLGFLFAPVFHPAMKHAARARAEIGMKTIFNLLGPMTNPAGVRRQVVGVYGKAAAVKVAEVYTQLSPVRVCVVNSEDGLDEFSPGAATHVAEIRVDRVSRYVIDPRELGLPAIAASTICGGTATENAVIALNVLRGEPGPYRDTVLLNAAAGLYVAGKSESIAGGLALAAESIDSGLAMGKLQSLIAFTNR